MFQRFLEVYRVLGVPAMPVEVCGQHAPAIPTSGSARLFLFPCVHPYTRVPPSLHRMDTVDNIVIYGVHTVRWRWGEPDGGCSRGWVWLGSRKGLDVL